MPPALFFLGGVLARALPLAFREFKKGNLAVLGLAALMGLLSYGRMIGNSTSHEATIIGTMIFIGFVAFGFKDRFLPTITEGTLLLYGAAALYVFELNFGSSTSPLLMNLERGLVAYVCITLALCVARIRIPAVIQVVLAVCFLASNLVLVSGFFQLSYLAPFCDSCTFEGIPAWSLFFTGFVFFQLVGNLLFILYFVPVPLSKHQSFRARFAKIRQHAQDLEKKYLDIDLHFFRTAGVLLIGGALVANAAYGIVDEWVAVSLALLIGDPLVASPHSSDSA